MRTVQNMNTKSYHKYKDAKYANLKERIERMKQSVDPNYLVESLGFEIIRDNPKEIRAACMIHGGDNSTAFRFNKETNTWVCFTNKCHEVYGNDIIGLIQSVTKKDFIDAVEFLKQFSTDVSDIDFIESKRKKEMEVFMKSYKDLNERPDKVNEAFLEAHKSVRSNYFLMKGFSNKTIDKNDFKYILTPGFEKQDCLYNMNEAQNYISDKPLIIVEGFKSVWRLHEYGIKNVVATMGAGITEGQEFLLCLYATNGIVTFFDNDKAGVTATIKASETLSKRLKVTPVFIQEIDEKGKGLDPADLSREQIYEYLDSYF
jgi:5S rRNA maturation endonuclease (ribonuclease M5)